jgi:hypothetical protein
LPDIWGHSTGWYHASPVSFVQRKQHEAEAELITSPS